MEDDLVLVHRWAPVEPWLVVDGYEHVDLLVDARCLPLVLVRRRRETHAASRQPVLHIEDHPLDHIWHVSSEPHLPAVELLALGNHTVPYVEHEAIDAPFIKF